MNKLLLFRGSWHALPEKRNAALVRPVFAALGNFDGVHRGHQQVLEVLLRKKAEAGGGTVLLVSFYPHPLRVLRPGEPLSVLTSFRQKVGILARVGLDALALLHFTPQLARLSAGEFVRAVLF